MSFNSLMKLTKFVKRVILKRFEFQHKSMYKPFCAAFCTSLLILSGSGDFGGPGGGFGGPGDLFFAPVAVVACHYFYQS